MTKTTYELKIERDHQAKPIMYAIDENGCWNCTSHANVNSGGYFRVYYFGVPWSMHRLVCHLFVESITKEDDVVMHSCDNVNCINPAHLKKGTVLENIQDMVKKGRQCKGAAVSTGKLNKSKVKKIYRNSITKYSVLAQFFGISKRSVVSIKSGECWGHYTKQFEVGRTKKDYASDAKSIPRCEITGVFLKKGEQIE